MKRILNSAILAISAVAFIFSMQSCNSVKPIEKSKLEGYWVLKTLKGEDAKQAFEGTMPSIEFDFAKSRVYGSGGCNRYTGGFKLTELNLFTATGAASTMMACVHANKEPLFLQTLSTPELVLSIKKDGVLSFAKDKNVVLEFVKGEAPIATGGVTKVNAETLAGAWTLTSVAGGDMAKLFTGKTPTMVFTADGNVSGNGGCNSYRGTYKLDMNTVAFGPLMSTKMACPSLDGETMFMGLLATPLQASINGDKLIMLKEGKKVLEFTKAMAK